MVGDETMSVLEIWGAEYQEQVYWGESVLRPWMPSRLCVNLNYTALVPNLFPTLWLIWNFLKVLFSCLS